MWNQILANALSGFLAAVLVDVNAWKADPNGASFDFRVAIPRWLMGALSGLTVGYGTQVSA